MLQVPTLALSHMRQAERRTYILADKIAQNANWDTELLAIELQSLIDLEFDVELTGFSLAEIDFAIDDARAARPSERDEPADRVAD